MTGTIRNQFFHWHIVHIIQGSRIWYKIGLMDCSLSHDCVMCVFHENLQSTIIPKYLYLPTTPILADAHSTEFLSILQVLCKHSKLRCTIPGAYFCSLPKVIEAYI